VLTDRSHAWRKILISVDQEHLIIDITHNFISQVAPQELIIFQGVSEAYFKDPERFIKPHTAQEDLLGIGVGEVVAILTPVTLTIVTNVLSSLVQKTIEPVGAWSWTALKNRFKKFRGHKTEAKTIILPLTPDQLTLVQELTLLEASKFKLPKSQATLLADAIVGKITTTQAKQHH